MSRQYHLITRNDRVDTVAKDMSFAVDDGSDLKMVVYTPLTDENTAFNFEQLLEDFDRLRAT